MAGDFSRPASVAFAAFGGGRVSRFRARVTFAAVPAAEVSPPEASDFFLGEKVTKKPLRTYGSKDSLMSAVRRPSNSGAWASKGL